MDKVMAMREAPNLAKVKEVASDEDLDESKQDVVKLE